MADTSATPNVPSVETRQTNFEQGIAYALHLWPDLTLAVREQLGGPDSSDKRDWLAGAVVDLFPPFSPASSSSTTTTTSSAPAPASSKDDDLDNTYIQDFLKGVMEDEFELVLDDNDVGIWRVAEQIVLLRRDCAVGKFDNVELMRQRWSEGQGKKIEYRKADDADQDTDWDSDDGDEDEDDEMGEAPPLVERREKPQPEVDEDGFTKVTRKR